VNSANSRHNTIHLIYHLQCNDGIISVFIVCDYLFNCYFIDLKTYVTSLLQNVTGGIEAFMAKDEMIIQFPAYMDALNGILLTTVIHNKNN
jgi:hypothetical protein